MMINSLNLQSRMAFGSNPYNDLSNARNMTDEQVGKEILMYAGENLYKLAEGAQSNIAKNAYSKKADLLVRIFVDTDPKSTELKKSIGKQIRTYA